MKIGVAFSGSGACASNVHLFVNQLEKNSVTIDMISVTSFVSLPLLLWAYGLSPSKITNKMHTFCSMPSYQTLKTFEEEGLFRKKKRCKIAVSCVDTCSGITVIYSDDLISDAWNLKVFPLSGNEYTALAATMSPHINGETVDYRDMHLCDFSIRYGCPFFPLKMAGMERLLSVICSGGETPSQIASDSLCLLTGKNADLSYVMAADLVNDSEKAISLFADKKTDELYDNLLF